MTPSKPRLTEIAHRSVLDVLMPGDWAIDATAGNGHDTAVLAAAVGSTGRVFAFDVQPRAIAAARARLTGCPHVVFFEAGHETMSAHLPAEAVGRVKVIMFNLGYLPGGEKSIITRAETTLVAIEQALRFIMPGGRITLMLYPGHAGGDTEASSVRAFLANVGDEFMIVHHERDHAGPRAPALIVALRRLPRCSTSPD